MAKLIMSFGAGMGVSAVGLTCMKRVGLTGLFRMKNLVGLPLIRGPMQAIAVLVIGMPSVLLVVVWTAVSRIAVLPLKLSLKMHLIWVMVGLVVRSRVVSVNAVWLVGSMWETAMATVGS